MIPRKAHARFWAKVQLDPVFGCWLWAAHRTGGYGVFGLDTSRKFLAHRISFTLIRGAIPSGKQLDHLCRVRACVNPDHLDVVTCRENLLRGNTFQAMNARKQSCPRGHPYDRIYCSAQGPCRICVAANQRRRYWRKKGRVA